MNGATLSLVISIVLTMFTEFLILEYIRNNVGIIVAICTLTWTLVSWIFFLNTRKGWLNIMRSG